MYPYSVLNQISLISIQLSQDQNEYSSGESAKYNNLLFMCTSQKMKIEPNFDNCYDSASPNTDADMRSDAYVTRFLR